MPTLQPPTITDARVTLHKLINTHRQTIKDIDDGQIFWRDGVNASLAIRAQCITEIGQCIAVIHALDRMKAGDIKRAAALCEQIKEFLPPTKGD